jgi:hypothetical protein
MKLCVSEFLPKEWNLHPGRVDECGGADVQVLHVHQEVLHLRCRLNKQEYTFFYLRF